MRKFVLLFLGVLAILVSCKKDDPAQTTLRFMHYSANAPVINYYIGNDLFIGNNSYPAPTPYQRTNAGTITINARQQSNGASLFNVEGTFNQDKFYSIVLFDSLSKLKVTAMEDDKTAPPSGKAYVRFLHLATGEGAVDIIKAGGPTKLFTNRSFNDHSGNSTLTRYTAIDPGPFSCAAIVAGSPNVLITQLPSFAATAGKSYTLILRGFKDAPVGSDARVFLSPIEDN